MTHSVHSVLVGMGLCGLLWSGNAAAQATTSVELSGAAAIQRASALGLPLRQTMTDGRPVELYRFYHGVPQYLTTFNRTAQDTIGVDELQPGGSTGLNLTGSGVIVGMWDSGSALATHFELSGRSENKENVASTAHATHVGVTICGLGLYPLAEGMAPSALLNSYYWDHDLAEMQAEAQQGLVVSNHSYGSVRGWANFGGVPYWLGDTRVSASEDYLFGYYDHTALAWDLLCHGHPDYLPVKAAGNDRTDVGPTSGSHMAWNGVAFVPSTVVRQRDGGTSGYDTIETSGVAKNILTVGAVGDIIGGHVLASQVVVEPYSNFGPTDDGRIKPDVVANGAALISGHNIAPNAYFTSSGTSMAAPCVTGTIALLQEHYRNLFGVTAPAALMKAIIIHSASEAGPALGPDYKHGWGLVNARNAAHLITDIKEGRATVIAGAFGTGQSQVVNIPNDAYGVRVTLSYTDLPGQVPLFPVLDPTTPQLVNDLDIRIDSAPTSTGPWTPAVYPWVLNPNAPSANATRGNNDLDNVERIDSNLNFLPPGPIKRHRLVIGTQGTITGLQPFYVILAVSRLSDVPPARPSSAILMP